MPLYLAAWTIVTASYLEFLSAIFTNYWLPASLHWLPVKYRIVFKIISITFKAIHGLAPALETP